MPNTAAHHTNTGIAPQKYLSIFDNMQPAFIFSSTVCLNYQILIRLFGTLSNYYNTHYPHLRTYIAIFKLDNKFHFPFFHHLKQSRTAMHKTKFWHSLFLWDRLKLQVSTPKAPVWIYVMQVLNCKALVLCCITEISNSVMQVWSCATQVSTVVMQVLNSVIPLQFGVTLVQCFIALFQCSVTLLQSSVILEQCFASPLQSCVTLFQCFITLLQTCVMQVQLYAMQVQTCVTQLQSFSYQFQSLGEANLQGFQHLEGFTKQITRIMSID